MIFRGETHMEFVDVGYCFRYLGCRIFPSIGWLCNRLRPALRRKIMTLDYVLGALVTAGLLIYLTYALIRPERF